MSNKEEEIKIAGLSTKTVKNFIKWGILLSILGIGMTVVVFAVYGHFNPARNFDFEKIDAFGSLLSGLIGVVLTLVATLLILLTYNTQKKELAETVSIASKQSETMRIQQFENTFFNLLKTQRELSQLLQSKISSNANYFENTFNNINQYYKSFFQKGNPQKAILDDINTVHFPNLEERISNEKIEKIAIEISSFLFFKIERKNAFDHYFQHLNEIVKFIDDARPYDWTKYYRFLTSNLSTYELILYYYGLLFYPNIVKLPGIKHFFNRLDKSELIDKKHSDLHNFITIY
jgi:hypothetical protein